MKHIKNVFSIMWETMQIRVLLIVALIILAAATIYQEGYKMGAYGNRALKIEEHEDNLHLKNSPENKKRSWYWENKPVSPLGGNASMMPSLMICNGCPGWGTERCHRCSPLSGGVKIV